MRPSQKPEEQILLTIADQSKLDLVMEMLSHFDLVRAERIKAQSGETLIAAAPQGSEDDFWALAGLWEGRNIDLEKQRHENFERRTVNYGQ